MIATLVECEGERVGRTTGSGSGHRSAGLGARPGPNPSSDLSVHMAQKAGWQVEPVDEPVGWSAGECGLVDIEGLRYLVRVGLRSCGRAIAAPDEHVGGDRKTFFRKAKRSYNDRSKVAHGGEIGAHGWRRPLEIGMGGFDSLNQSYDRQTRNSF